MTVAAWLIGMNIGICPSGHRHTRRTVRCVGALFIPITGDIVHEPAMDRLVPGRLVPPVDNDIIGYCSAMAQARRMLKIGIITLEDFEKIDCVLLKKYNLSLLSLFRDKSLLYKENRGNMPH